MKSRDLHTSIEKIYNDIYVHCTVLHFYLKLGLHHESQSKFVPVRT